jgi:hypothetical protein
VTFDGKSLFVAWAGGSLTARVYRVELSSRRRELWKEFTPRDTGLVDFSIGAITPDGKTLVFGYTHLIPDLYLVEGLK